MQSSYSDSLCDSRENCDRVKEEIIRLTRLRGPLKSICPSEVARSCFSSSCWRLHMPLVRKVGFQLTSENAIEVCQRGLPVPNPSEETIKGPIRFRLKSQ